MFPTKEQRLAKWAITRTKGKFRFMIVDGALGWGLLTGLLYSLIMWLMAGFDLKVGLPLALVLFPIGGLVWGRLVWGLTEREFAQYRPTTTPD